VSKQDAGSAPRLPPAGDPGRTGLPGQLPWETARLLRVQGAWPVGGWCQGNPQGVEPYPWAGSGRGPMWSCPSSIAVSSNRVHWSWVSSNPLQNTVRPRQRPLP